MIFKCFSIVLIGFMLSACQAVSEETKTVEFYSQNEVQRKEKIAECNNNPGELAKTPNCINAKRSQFANIKGDSPRF